MALERKEDFQMIGHILAVVVLAATLAACGGSEPAAEPATPPPPATQPTTTEAMTHEEMEEETEPGTTAPTPEPAAIVIQVREAEPVGGVTEIEVKHGDEVDFEVDSDVPGIVHVHGYNLEQKVAPGKPARLTFEAALEGIFEIELHLDGDETLIAELRVEP